MTFTDEEIDDFLKAESRYHEGGLTREKAVQFLAQREQHSSPVRPAERAYRYDDQYGNERWSDTGEKVSHGHTR